MRGIPWNSERIQSLQRLWAAGATADAIAKELGGISRSAVMGKIYRLRLTLADPVQAVPRDGGGPKEIRSARPEPVRRRRRKRDRELHAPLSNAKKRGVSLLELTNDCCRWPHGRPGSRSFFFCGAPGANLERGMPYCPRHARRAYPLLGAAETTDVTARAAAELRELASAGNSRTIAEMMERASQKSTLREAR